jgi:hypothetical protein
MAYKYCTATNWGKNFFTHEERRQFHLSGHPGEVWKSKRHKLLGMHCQLKIKRDNLDQHYIIFHSL